MKETTILDSATYEHGDAARNGLPLEEFWRLQSESPCHRQEFDDPGILPWAWVLTRHLDVLSVDRDEETFSSARGVTLRQFEPIVVEHGGKPGMMAADGRDHIRNRRIVARGFTPTVLKLFQANLDRIVHQVLDAALLKHEVDFVNDVAVDVPLRAASELIGVPLKDQPDVLRWTNNLAYPTDPSQVATQSEVMASMASLCEYGLSLAALRRDEPRTDLMSMVAAAHQEEQLSEDEIQGMMILLALGGNETTRNALSHGLNALMNNPDQMALLRSDLDTYLPSATEEILRISSPLIYLRRTATKHVEIHGQSIAPGDVVVMHFAAANHDRAVFDTPETFDISRTPNPHLALGAGPHVCLGQAVARMEIRTLFRDLLGRTTNIEPTGPVAYTRDSLARGVRTLPVRLEAA